MGAVASADVDGLKAILAPEFQLLRATGVGYDREGYIASGLPTIKEWQVEDLVATASDELLVARYELVVDETIEGVPVARRAPRLTVFRQKVTLGWSRMPLSPPRDERRLLSQRRKLAGG